MQAFVSYAGEDREVAQAIARDLTQLGVPIFYDRDSLNVGDSIIDRIHDALNQADFGILVVSPEFLEKNWPQHETRQLVRDYIEAMALGVTTTPSAMQSWPHGRPCGPRAVAS